MSVHVFTFLVIHEAQSEIIILEIPQRVSALRSRTLLFGFDRIDAVDCKRFHDEVGASCYSFDDPHILSQLVFNM